MSSRPLVAITPTWRRHDLLLRRCVPSVFNQIMPVDRHIIVSDGPDESLRGMFADDPLVTFIELPDHDLELSNWGARARNRALEELDGNEYVYYCDDDNAWRPSHTRLLARVLDDDDQVDFAYSRMLVHSFNGRAHEVGSAPPVIGQIDTSLIAHRARTPFLFGMWPSPGKIDRCPDWEMVATWLDAGATWAFAGAVTVDYWLGTPDVTNRS